MKRIIFTLLLLVPVITEGQVITTVAGTGSSVFSGEGMPATVAGVPNPSGGAFDKHGNYYFGDGVNSHRIRKINTSGIITTVAGNGMGGYAGDGGQATVARLNRPYGIKLDSAGNLYIADKENNRIRKVDVTTGIITTIAGTGVGGYNGDGISATSAQIWGAEDIEIDKYGNVYIADMLNSRVRKIDHAGIITTIAGNGTGGFSGDGGPATNAQITYPTGLVMDSIGNLYIADWSSFSNRVRKVNTSGIITTVAGNGSSVYSGDGIPATAGGMVTLRVTLDNFNNLYITDRYNHRVYKVNLLTGILYCIAGNGINGDFGDGGLATAASLNYPVGIAVDECGNVYITTVGELTTPGTGRRIRKVTFNPSCNPTLETKQIKPVTEISIYPNPTTSLIHIDNLKPNTTYQLLSIVGAVMQSGNLKEGNNTISMQHLAPGMYLLHLTGEAGERVVTKIIKQQL